MSSLKQFKTNRWIKEINIEEELSFNVYKRKNDFIHVANVELDLKKKRQTVIQFLPVINDELFKVNKEWIYLFTINDKIVKIGGTRNGLRNRCGSYLCGHHIEERGKKETSSITNRYIYNTFDYYLRNNGKIKMYAKDLIPIKIKQKILDENVEILTQTYHAYESVYLNDFKKYNDNKIPILNYNYDPNKNYKS